MCNLTRKKILLAITGSIAAYKALELIRLLRELEADVKVVMTKEAGEFVTELSLQALLGQPIYRELLNHESEASMSHISLAKWAEVLLVAPATANIMAKFAHGIADDLLSTLYLATNASVALVPAMNQQMWQHPATQNNKTILMERDVAIWGPGFGLQACGDIGPGRMLEPAEILTELEYLLAPKILSGKKIVVTAGPTRELIDPVRYISNYSSGKMGLALAQQAHLLGAETLLIMGPTHLTLPNNLPSILVETAEEMLNAVMQNISDGDIFIATAAVADFGVQQKSTRKIKKSQLSQLKLVHNPDILLAVSQLENPPFLVGFAAETENICGNAFDKLQRKNLDIVIANQVGIANSGFHSDYNEVFMMTPNAKMHLSRKTKIKLADEILSFILQEYTKKINSPVEPLVV